MNMAFAIEIRKGGRGEDRAAHFADNDRHVFVLADGAGGVGGGAFAAECVVRAAEKLASGVYGSAVEALSSVDAELGLHGCLSTGVIVEIQGGKLRGASCGDSVAWLIQGERVLELTERQSRKPLLGAGGAPVSFGSVDFQGILMLASDGLVNYSSRKTIIDSLGVESITAAAKALAELPRLRSGGYPDDVAVILSRTKA